MLFDQERDRVAIVSRYAESVLQFSKRHIAIRKKHGTLCSQLEIPSGTGVSDGLNFEYVNKLLRIASANDNFLHDHRATGVENHR